MRALPTPFHFLRFAWRSVRKVPAVWLVRGGFELAAYLYRFAFFFGVGLLFVIHFGLHLQSGMPLELWVPRLMSALAQPHTFVAFGGLFAASWGVLFAAESLAYAGLWSALRNATLGAARPWADAFQGAFDAFGRAIGVRLLVRVCEAALFATIVASGLAVAQFGWTAHVASDSLAVGALVCATLLFVLSIGIVVLRLTTELVATTVFLDDTSLGEGILRAAHLMAQRPFFVYRLFIVAAAVVIPPLLVGWVLALVQNALLFAEATALASMLRFGAELAIVVGLVMFSVMMHATFFAYYAWATHRIEPEHAVKDEHPGLADLLPKRYEHVANVDDILGPWDDADVRRPPAAPAPAPKQYDLSAILSRRSRDEEE